MAAILRRTVFMEADKRSVLEGKTFFRPSDWSLVETSIGTMAEPYNAFTRYGISSDAQPYDSEDEMSQVNDIKYVDLDKITSILSPANVIGGSLMPRTGR